MSPLLAVCLQDSESSKFRPLEELKRDMAQLDLLVETDVQVHHSELNMGELLQADKENKYLLFSC